MGIGRLVDRDKRGITKVEAAIGIVWDLLGEGGLGVDASHRECDRSAPTRYAS